MTDYTIMPLGPLAPNRHGEIAECPYCGKRGLKLEDFKDWEHSKEKEFVYIHSDDPQAIRTLEDDGRIVVEYVLNSVACPVRPISKTPTETPRE